MIPAGGLSASTNDQTSQTTRLDQSFGGINIGSGGLDMKTIAIAAGAAVVIIGALLLFLRRR